MCGRLASQTMVQLQGGGSFRRRVWWEVPGNWGLPLARVVGPWTPVFLLLTAVRGPVFGSTLHCHGMLPLAQARKQQAHQPWAETPKPDPKYLTFLSWLSQVAVTES